MFWKKKKPDYPVERLEYEEYFVVKSRDVAQLSNENVKFDGILVDKPVVDFFSTGWSWSISSRLIEEDHGHRTRLKINDVTVYFKGPLYLRKGKKITVWGKIKSGIVQAKRIESVEVIYQS